MDMGKKMNFDRNERLLLAACVAGVTLTIGIFGYAQDCGAKSGPDAHAKYQVKPAPVWTKDGELVLPVDWRRWVFMGAPITPNGLNDGHANFAEIHNTYVQREAFDWYRKTGQWPEGTIMLKEMQHVLPGDGPGGSRTEPSGNGYFPGVPNGVDCSVKDSVRFPKSKNWGFFNFGHHAAPYAATAKEAPLNKCAGCHIANAPEDMVFVNFYKPVLTPLPAPVQNPLPAKGE